MVDFSRFVNILNKHLFGVEKAELIRKIADHPERYVGLFRPTTPKSKILQNLLQSREIRFGNALEDIIREFIKDWGFVDIPNKKFTYQGIDYDLDQYFTDNTTYYFIEQKVRDDHDSTKKRGQMSNFKIKLEYLYRKHGKNLVGIMYFVDPSLVKNKNYYLTELSKEGRKYGVSLYLFYGKELFDYFCHPQDWDKLLDWLYQWKQQLPEFPEIDFDTNPRESFKQLKDVELKYWEKLTKEEQLWEQGIIKVLSSRGKVLNMVADYLIRQPSERAKKVGSELKSKISQYYRQKE
jgi:hypothetical protein